MDSASPTGTPIGSGFNDPRRYLEPFRQSRFARLLPVAHEIRLLVERQARMQLKREGRKKNIIENEIK